MESWHESSGGLDFTPPLLAIVLAFVVLAAVALSHSLPGGERGLLLFEKACPIYQSTS
jgi:hypothetical protein